MKKPAARKPKMFTSKSFSPDNLIQKPDAAKTKAKMPKVKKPNMKMPKGFKEFE